MLVTEDIINIEQPEELQVLEGDVIPAVFNVKLFDTLEELTSYINAFSIQRGEWLVGTVNGKVVYQLSCNRDII